MHERGPCRYTGLAPARANHSTAHTKSCDTCAIGARTLQQDCKPPSGPGRVLIERAHMHRGEHIPVCQVVPKVAMHSKELLQNCHALLVGACTASGGCCGAHTHSWPVTPTKCHSHKCCFA
jgi:hypothetical protein